MSNDINEKGNDIMKACIIQPPYSRDVAYSDAFFNYKLEMLNKGDESVDIIVLPEYSDVPCATATKEETVFYHKKYINTLLDKCIETAKRCNSLVFVNALSKEERMSFRISSRIALATVNDFWCASCHNSYQAHGNLLFFFLKYLIARAGASLNKALS